MINLCQNLIDRFKNFFFFLMIRRPPRSTQSRSSAASDVYKRQVKTHHFLASRKHLLRAKHHTRCQNFQNVPYTRTWKHAIPHNFHICLLYTSPSPRDRTRSRMPSSA
eukprot:TRINITY_DN97_c0_g1_i2.p1 TRINITY_DN97_c0_g1~~TRINITY_DN97_c0_g1_i2.p1  ORF type:complete len:108 (-),score=46.08 TRINITY_DN97_c0_g1_i2:126-449(-)